MRKQRYILSTKFYFSDERVYISFPSYVYRGFRRPTNYYYFLADRFGIDYPFDARGYFTCIIILFYHAINMMAENERKMNVDN